MGNKRKVWLACGATIGLPLSGAAQTVQQVQVTKADGHVVVHVIGSDLTKPTQVSLWKKGTAYTLEWAAGLATSGERIRVDNSDVTSVWYGWFSSKPRKVRLQVHTTHASDPVLTRVSDGWTISFGGKLASAEKPSAAKNAYMADMPVEPAHRAVGLAGQTRDSYAAPGTLEASIQSPNGGKWMISEQETKASQHVAQKPKPQPPHKDQPVQLVAATTYVPQPQGRKVSVDCTNADLAQVLKGLAMQSGANIVIGPDVKGKVTADLHNVSIDEALHYMAYLTGVKYTKADGIYMFGSAPESDHPSSTIQPPAEPVPSLVKVVPILSDSEMQVKAAIESRFKGKDLQVLTPQQAAQNSGIDRMSHDAASQSQTALQAPGDSSKSLVIPESYLILVGGEDVVTEADRIAREVDKEILKAHVSYVSADRIDRSMVMYDVKFADPRALRENLLTEVPGLRIIPFPNSAGASLEYTEGRAKTQANEDNSLNQQIGTNNNSAATPLPGGGAEGSVSAVSTQEVSDGSLEEPFTKEEKASVPMRLVLRGTREQISQALEYLKVLDIAPRQVALELRVMELTKEDALKAGIDWNIFTGGAVKVINLNNSQANPSNTANIHVSGNNFGGDIGVQLDALVSANKLLARPNIVAMDGRQSEIFVGDIIRYVQSITNSQNGISVTTGEVPTGVRLSVLPRVGGDGNLTLELRPRISLLTSFTTVPGGGQLPQTSTRFAQSTISMKSGQTLAIGGLIQDQDIKSYSGIPILMNLPIIGNLFRQTNLTRNRTELVIFLTAKSIDGPVTADKTLPLQEDLHIGEGH